MIIVTVVGVTVFVVVVVVNVLRFCESPFERADFLALNALEPFIVSLSSLLVF